jgi:hypothetical protein
MATKAQIEANRRNAEKSTGPRTPEGKARSSVNHRSHGFTTTNFFFSFEKSEQFDALLSDFVVQFRPACTFEQILVEKMAQNHWINLHAVALQTDFLEKSVRNHFVTQHLGVLIRYQTAAERAFYKAYDELGKIQKEREKCEIGFESKIIAEPVVTKVAAATAAAAPSQTASTADPSSDLLVNAQEETEKSEIGFESKNAGDPVVTKVAAATAAAAPSIPASDELPIVTNPRPAATDSTADPASDVVVPVVTNVAAAAAAATPSEPPSAPDPSSDLAVNARKETEKSEIGFESKKSDELTQAAEVQVQLTQAA